MGGTHQLYDALGVASNASKEEIKRAYKQLAMVSHPDKGGDPEDFKKISHAYQVLSDDQKRKEYDMLGDEGYENQHRGGGGEMDPHQFFQQFFGGNPFGNFTGFGGGFPENPFGAGGRARRQQCAHHRHVMRISLDEAYHGLRKAIKVQLQKHCISCMGMCYTCQGRGSITDMKRMGFMTQMITRPCDACRGQGRVAQGKPDCGNCKGRGSYATEEKVEVVVPRGVDTGHCTTIPKMGAQPTAENEEPGDLVIEIQVQPHAELLREGDNLVYHVPLTFAETVLGKVITIPHFQGNLDMDLRDLGVLNPQHELMVEGRGMPKMGKEGEFGKLVVRMRVTYPPSKRAVWTPEQRATLARVFEAAGLLI